MGQLSGRSIKTTITKLDVVSNDNSTVLMFQRDGDDFVIRTRLAHQSSWDSNDLPRYSISEKEARLLGLMLKGDDAQYEHRLEEVGTSEFRTPAPETHTEDEIRADCTQLDIERAKAENLREERELLGLQNEREHALDKHVGADVPGCPACERKFATVTAPQGWDRSDEDTVNGTTDPDTGEDLPF